MKYFIYTFLFFSTHVIYSQNLSIRAKVINGNDDVEVSTRFLANSNDLELGGFDLTNLGKQYVAIRFQNINLPTDAVINKAYIQFTTKTKKTTTAQLTVKCQKGNALSYVATENLLNRSYVPEVVAWNPLAWTLANERSIKQQTPDLSAQIMAAIATGWQSGNALSFVIQGNATINNVLNACSYETNATRINAPELVIEYALPTCVNDVLAPTFSNCPPSITLQTLDTTAVARWAAPTVSDNCTQGITPSVSSSPKLGLVSGSAFPIGSTTITYNANDLANNNANPCSFTVNVEFIKALKVTNSLMRGIVKTPSMVVLSAPENTTIRYTTNHSMPSRTNGTIYTAPIPITRTTVLKTIVYSNTSASQVESFTYIFPVKGREMNFPTLITDDEYENSLKQLPIMCFSTNIDTVISKTEKLCSIEYINKFGDTNSVSIQAGVYGYGNAAYNSSEQKNIRFICREEYGAPYLEYPIFKRDDVSTYEPTTKFVTLGLRVGQDGASETGFGMTQASQTLISKTMRELGNVDLHTQYVHAFVNGSYNGIYTLKEHFDRDFAASYYGGDSKTFDNINNSGNWLVGGVNTDIRGLPQGNITNWNALRLAAQQNYYQTVKSYLNVKQYIDMMLVLMYFDIEPEFRAVADQNLVATKFFFENHDTDGALVKTVDDNEFVYDEKWTSPNFSFIFKGPGGIFANLMAGDNLEFRTLLRDRVYDAFQKPNGALTVQRVNDKLLELKNIMRPIISTALARFNITFYNDYDEEFNANTAHMPIRYQYNLDRWLSMGYVHTLAPVAFSEVSGNVTLPVLLTNTNLNSTIYYTLDGSDPMGNDGVISPLAKLYTDQLALNIGENKVVARPYKNGEFGPKTTANYTSAVAVAAQEAVAPPQYKTEKQPIVPSFSLYPNPAKESVALDLSSVEGKAVSITVYNNVGKVVFNEQIEQAHISKRIHTQSWEAGQYFVSIQTDGKDAVLKKLTIIR